MRVLLWFVDSGSHQKLHPCQQQINRMLCVSFLKVRLYHKLNSFSEPLINCQRDFQIVFHLFNVSIDAVEVLLEGGKQLSDVAVGQGGCPLLGIYVFRFIPHAGVDH